MFLALVKSAGSNHMGVRFPVTVSLPAFLGCLSLCTLGVGQLWMLVCQGFELKRRGELKLIKVFQSEVSSCLRDKTANSTVHYLCVQAAAAADMRCC